MNALSGSDRALGPWLRGSCFMLVLALAGCQTTGTDSNRLHGAFFNDIGFASGDRAKFENDMRQVLPEPETARLIIFNHGTNSSGIHQTCDPSGDIPPIFRTLPRSHAGTVVYYFCSDVTGLGTRGGMSAQTWYRRGREIEALLDRFIAFGVKPERIFLAGQSGGASAVLSTAAAAPEKFRSFVAFAPGYGYAYLGWGRRHHRLSHFYGQWASHIRAGKAMRGLVFGFGDDKYAPTPDLQFLGDIPGVQLITVGNAACDGANPHFYAWTRCFYDKYRRTLEVWFELD